jgi:nucleoid-associated protein Lsr2
MAQKVLVTYACDYDRKEIPAGQERTRSFGLDGQSYEIDLCKEHSGKLDEVLKKYAAYAQKATRGPRRRRRTAAHRQRSAQIRAWAKDRGMPVSDRGRIPSEVIDSYETTHH